MTAKPLAFLQSIAADIAQQHPDPQQLKNYCFVFPTRRAGIYFRKYLTQMYAGRYFFSPQIWNIVEFTEQLSETVILDDIPLVLELFKTYRQIEPEVRFDSFYAWGKLILSDFDEIDRYMVDAAALFANLKDLRSLEETFSLPAEQLPYLQQFWRILQKDNATELEQEFIKIWQVLGQVYVAFQQSLLAQNAAYMGMAQRHTVELLASNQLSIPFQQIIFAGFNDLTVTEQRIINDLTAQQKATVYWDTDRFYMDSRPTTNAAGRETHIPNQHEAGNFLRRYYQQYAEHPAHRWGTKTDFAQTEKHIHIIGTPLRVGQAKYAGQTIQQRLAQHDLDLQDTALILGDETLLFPMLYALPPNIETVNVTMGYPLRHTPIYQLLEALVQLQKTRQDRANKNDTAEQSDLNSSDTSEQVTKQQIPTKNQQESIADSSSASTLSVFYSKIVLQILNNPYIKSYDREAIEIYMGQAERNNWVYVSPKTLCTRLPHPIFALIFQPCETFQSLTAQFENLLLLLFTDLQKKYGISTDPNAKTDEYAEPEARNSHALTPPPNLTESEQTPLEEPPTAKPALELEFIYHALLQVRKLDDSLRRYRHPVSIDTFWKILREVLQSVKLAFEGEPLRGLQIMDFLEARTIDFKNVFILGMNEGIIPSSRANATFIPVNLRRAFAMPTFLDQDAIYGYHFYRLLQRADHVWLLYNTETSSTGSEERSRYLLQLMYELNANNAPHLKIHIETATAPLTAAIPRTQPLTISKKGDIALTMNQYVANNEAQNPDNLSQTTAPRSLSPTALTMYINCPVQFYYRYIAQLQELSNVDEDINALIFGKVLHRSLELLYQQYRQYPITAAAIDKIIAKPNHIEKQLNQAFRDNKFDVPKDGHNLLLKRVLQKLIYKILENDKKDVPFSIVGLEAHDYKTALLLEDGRAIALSGTIDRIDSITYQADGLPAFRILDYKTGLIKIQKDRAINAKLDVYFEKYFTQPDYKAGFQAYLYAYLFWVNNNRNARIVIGIYDLPKINQGISYLRNGELIYNELFEAFEQRLKQLLIEIFNYEMPFIQTDDPKRYDYSAYKKLASL